MKTMKDLCGTADGDRGGPASPDIRQTSAKAGKGDGTGRVAGEVAATKGTTHAAVRRDGAKAAKRARRTPTVANGAYSAAGVVPGLKRQRSGDMTAEEAAATLVAASTKRPSDIRAALAAKLRRAEPQASAAASAAETDTRNPVLDSTGDALASAAVQGQRHKGSVRVKEVQALAAKVVVTPGQTRIRRNAADQAWWVVQ